MNPPAPGLRAQATVGEKAQQQGQLCSRRVSGFLAFSDQKAEIGQEVGLGCKHQGLLPKTHFLQLGPTSSLHSTTS